MGVKRVSIVEFQKGHNLKWAPILVFNGGVQNYWPSNCLKPMSCS